MAELAEDRYLIVMVCGMEGFVFVSEAVLL